MIAPAAKESAKAVLPDDNWPKNKKAKGLDQPNFHITPLPFNSCPN